MLPFSPIALTAIRLFPRADRTLRTRDAAWAVGISSSLGEVERRPPST